MILPIAAMVLLMPTFLIMTGWESDEGKGIKFELDIILYII